MEILMNPIKKPLKEVAQLSLGKEVDVMVEELATLGDKQGTLAGDLLNHLMPFADPALVKVSEKDRKPTWYKECIDSVYKNLMAKEDLAKRMKLAWYSAFDTKETAKKDSDYPVVLTESGTSYVPTISGATPDLVLSAKGVMNFTVSNITAWTAEGSKDPKSASYDALGVSRKEWVMPVRDEVNKYTSGKARDLRGSLTKALKKSFGVATNVKADTQPTPIRIPISLSAIVSYRNKGVKDGDKWSAEQNKMFDEGVALIEKSCK
jgi:hypothetical protein